jgi:hypothetical protein
MFSLISLLPVCFLGLARNPRLPAELRPALDAAHQKSILIGASARACIMILPGRRWRPEAGNAA